ncbi:NHL repeat-containing protein, partial [Catenuloplanes japonicus]|uniref:hypothetical protein n=1 Tax=Catenuloplanes japonicus TaxID=33876 RepID=UPI0005259543
MTATVAGVGAGMAVSLGAVVPTAAVAQPEPTIALPQYQLSVIAGNNDLSGLPTAGPARQSLMSEPTDMAFDPAGNLYVADTGNCVIEKITPALQLSVFAGLPTGCQPPLPRNQVFHGRMVSLAWLQGKLYVGSADTGYIYSADANGNLTPVAGNGAEGPPSNNQVNTPTQMVGHGNYLYFGDQDEHQVGRIDVTASPATIELVAGNGDNIPAALTGPGQDARTTPIVSPNGVAVAADGTIYVSDTGESRVLKLSSNFEVLDQWMLPAAVGLALDSTGSTLYAASYAGAITAMATDGYSYGGVIAGMNFSAIAQIAVDQVSAQKSSTVVEGPALATEVGQPAGVEVAANGDIYATISSPSMLARRTADRCEGDGQRRRPAAGIALRADHELHTD